MFKALENAYEFAALPLRIGLAALFLTAGVLNVMNFAGATDNMASLGLPVPIVFAIIMLVSQLIGGTLILLGLLTRVAAIWMTIVLLFLVIMAHVVHYTPDSLIEITKYVAWIGGTLCLMLLGPGKLSLDEAFLWE
ncbi:MAG: DoxX family protein [Candidatus Woesearchaeota archaeon]